MYYVIDLFSKFFVNVFCRLGNTTMAAMNAGGVSPAAKAKA